MPPNQAGRHDMGPTQDPQNRSIVPDELLGTWSGHNQTVKNWERNQPVIARFQ
jgi:hypothetical protein